MSFKIGSLVAIFFLAGVFIFLAIPILVTWIDRIRFARRFEGLVRRGLIVPVLIRRADGKANTRRRVTAQALMDAWVNEATLGGDLQNWKPITAQFIAQEEDEPAIGSILTTSAQRKDAERFLKTVHRRRWRAESAVTGIQQQSSAERKGGEIRSCNLILMPSPSRRQFQGGALDNAKGARRFAATSSTTAPSGVLSEAMKSLGDDGRTQGLADNASAMALMHFELGIKESNLSGISEIRNLLKDIDEEASIVSLEDYDGYGSPETGPPAYTVVYSAGRPYIVPSRPRNPFLGTRTRIY